MMILGSVMIPGEMSERKAATPARPGQLASNNTLVAQAEAPTKRAQLDIPPFLNFEPIITPRDLQGLREKGIDPCTRRFIVGSFIKRLQTNHPDQQKLLADALAFSLREARKDREVLLSSAKAKKHKLLRREDKDSKPSQSPKVNDVDPESWIKNCPLPVLILLG